MNKRQLKKYRKNEKINEFKTKKTLSERQREFKNKELEENKIRKSLYISCENIKKIDLKQTEYLKKYNQKISKSVAINKLLDMC